MTDDSQDHRGGRAMRTFFTADTHFGHEGIVALCARPFADLDEMDRALIANWNAVVGPKDRVIHLGDFAHRCDPRRKGAIFGRLHGQKFLVPGNHDDAATTSLPWAGVKEILQIVVDGVRIVCCHYAMRAWPGANRGAVHLYGHSHGRLAGTSRSCDVGVDSWDFRPVSLAEIQLRLAMLPANEDVENNPEPGVT